jgi:hypothetical protein
LPVVFCGCVTGSLALREEIGMKAFESKMLRIFVPKRDVAIGGLRKLHNGEIHNLYSLPDVNRIMKSRRMRRTGHVARIRERPRRKWKDNIKMDLREIGWVGMDWINLAQDRNQ